MKTLELNHTSLSKIRKNYAYNIQDHMIREVISLKKGSSTNSKLYTNMYKYKLYDLKMGRPGKEIDNFNIKYKDGHKSNNPNDSTPTIFLNNDFVLDNKNRILLYSFTDIFKIMLKFIDNDNILNFLGVALIRMALLQDHHLNKEGNYRYIIPEKIINEIKTDVDNKMNIPLEVFLYNLELIALNEDVKYTTTGHTIKGGVGRYNNLMTYVHLINTLRMKEKLGLDPFLEHFMNFSGGLARVPTGISIMSFNKALEDFPILNPY